jgi:hypothetical protein
MAYKRNNAWELGSDWAGPILWYARGVKVMKARAAMLRPIGTSVSTVAGTSCLGIAAI